MRKSLIIIELLLLMIIISGCTRKPQDGNGSQDNNHEYGNGTIPNILHEIPQEYYSATIKQGSLIELNYNTYESFSYENSNPTLLTKRAIIYLPYNYLKETKYNIMYMMHGGWSNETSNLGTPNNPSVFKNVIDNAIANNDFDPLIIVCPTYNNTNLNGQDSDNYSLALQLTRNYHNELVNDLIPAVESNYSTYAENTSLEGIKASRNHRAFCGFSMGSVATWRAFEYCLDYFRYFFPSSGSITSSGQYMENIVEQSNHKSEDFFIFAMSGTDDFAYSSFTSQINAMLSTGNNIFVEAKNEKDGNLAYVVKEGNSHNWRAQTEYFYNALIWAWNSVSTTEQPDYTEDSKISSVISNPIFGNFGRLIFPVNQNYYSGETLKDLHLTWYNNINVGHTVEIVNYFKNQTLRGNQVFYDIYSENEKAADPQKENTGLFFFRGEKNSKFAVTCAGGGWAYVGAMHDSFPHALELSKRGYNAFAIIYRPGAQTAYEDLARAISFIYASAKTLEVDTTGYSVWGGSAGGRMAATISSYGVEQYGGSAGIPKPAAAIIQYTGHSDYNINGEVATFVTVGENDGIANYQVMKKRIDNLSLMGVATEYHSYPGLSHGFGLGIGTVAEGWFDKAISFWENNW